MCSLSEGESLAASNHQLRPATLPSWKRIYLDDKQDCGRIYQVLETGFTHPEALETVTDIVIKLEENKGLTCFPMKDEHSAPYIEREESRQVKPDHPLRKVLQMLDLENDGTQDPEEEEKLLKILTWNDPAVRIEREARLAADPQARNVQSFISFQDREFTHHAAPLILMMCPKVENLAYSSCPLPYRPDHRNGPYRGHLLLRTLLRNNYGKLPQMHLQHLRHVRLLPEVGLWYQGDDVYNFFDVLEEARLFHRLPAIESISVDGITRNNDADVLEHFPPGTSKVKRLHVGHSMLPSTDLVPLIRMSKSLEEFSHSVGGRDSHDGGYYILTAKKLGKALWSSRSSLRRLDLDVDSMLTNDSNDEDEDDEYDSEMDDSIEERDEYSLQDEQDSTGPLELSKVPDDRDYNNTIGSLHDFEQLTHLSLGVKLLLGPPDSVTPFQLVDALPKSLESLKIRGYTKGVVAKYDAAIGELLARRSEALPALTKVHGIEELIPSADVEPSRSAKAGKKPQYWAYEEEDKGWLAA